MDMSTTLSVHVALKALREAEKRNGMNEQERACVQKLAQCLNSLLKARGARSILYPELTSAQLIGKPMLPFTFKVDLSVR